MEREPSRERMESKGRQIGRIFAFLGIIWGYLGAGKYSETSHAASSFFFGKEVGENGREIRGVRESGGKVRINHALIRVKLVVIQG